MLDLTGEVREINAKVAVLEKAKVVDSTFVWKKKAKGVEAGNYLDDVLVTEEIDSMIGSPVEG